MMIVPSFRMGYAFWSTRTPWLDDIQVADRERRSIIYADAEIELDGPLPSHTPPKR